MRPDCSTVTAVAAAVVTTLIPAGGAAGQIASALLQEEGTLPGAPGDTIQFLNNPAVNHVGGYAISLSTTGDGGTLSRVWGNASGGAGDVMRTESTIGDFQQTSFESFYGISDEGQVAYSASCTDLVGGTTGLDSAYLDDTLLLIEEQPVDAFPGFFSSFNSRVGVSGNGIPYWIGGLTDTPGGSSQFRSMFAGTDAMSVLAAGDSVVGADEPIGTGSFGFDVRCSRLGSHYILDGVLDAATTINACVVIDGAIATASGGLLREGTAVEAGAGGLPDELWSAFDFFGINEAGDRLVTGDTNAATTTDEFVLINDAIVLREGAVLPGDLVVSGSIEGGYMNAAGDWAVTWDVDTETGNVEALIFNGAIVLLEGDPVDWNGDGVIDESDDGAVVANFTGISALTVGACGSDALVPLYFTADVDLDGGSTLEGFFCLRLASPRCTCEGDVDLNGIVDFQDLLEVLADWGPCPGCPADIDGNGIVDFQDLLTVLAEWGPCVPE
jgi:hypothetical protein